MTLNLLAQNKLRTLSESLTQDGVLQIGLGLVERANGELLRHRTVPKTGDLRKDEPDPVAGFSSGSELFKDCMVGVRLGGEEALEVIGICHEQASQRSVILISFRSAG